MSKYLLTCGCGKTVPVEIGQAGGQVICACGAELDVPPLRKLRHLPVATPAVGQPTSAWSARQGMITACLILAVGLAVIGLWNRVTEPTVPKFDAAAQQQARAAVEVGLKTMTPAQAWQRWVEVYRPLAERGFSVFESPAVAAIEQYVAKRRFLQKTLLSLAATCAAVAVIAAIWPRAETRRQGNKGTRKMR